MRFLLKRIWLYLRIPGFKLHSCKVSHSSQIGRHVLLQDSNIGGYVHIGPNCVINSAVIGSYSSIAPHVQIGGLEHPYWELSTSTFLTDKSVRNKTIIGNDVWIGASAIIKAGICIGDGAVVGANSFVNKDVPPYTIVVGSPARIVKHRFKDSLIKELSDSRYWELCPTEAKKKLETITQIIQEKDEK